MKEKTHKQLNKIAFDFLKNIGFKKSYFLGVRIKNIFSLGEIGADLKRKKVFSFSINEFEKISGFFEIKLKNYKIVHFCFTVL